jgi:hypothetical protein
MNPRFLDSALVGGEWSASRSSRFTPQEMNAEVHYGQEVGGITELLWAVLKRRF